MCDDAQFVFSDRAAIGALLRLWHGTLVRQHARRAAYVPVDGRIHLGGCGDQGHRRRLAAVPAFGDQTTNGLRAVSLGLGAIIPNPWAPDFARNLDYVTPELIKEKVEWVLQSEDVKQACREMKKKHRARHTYLQQQAVDDIQLYVADWNIRHEKENQTPLKGAATASTGAKEKVKPSTESSAQAESKDDSSAHDQKVNQQKAVDKTSPAAGKKSSKHANKQRKWYSIFRFGGRNK